MSIKGVNTGILNSALIVGAESDPVLESVRDALEINLFWPLLVGNAHVIRRKADALGIDNSSYDVMHATGEEEIMQMSFECVRRGAVGMIVKGSIPTDVFLKGILARDNGLRADTLMSHLFRLTMPGRERPLFITDAVLHVSPTTEELIVIATNAIKVITRINEKKPKVAVLSATERKLDAIPSSIAAQTVALRVREDTGVIIEGPCALDTILSSDAARIKGIASDIAGSTDIIVVPNIETGNALYKALVYVGGAIPAGVIVGGAIPIVLTSRADLSKARLASYQFAYMVAEKRHK